jgi:hypothetical protein
VIKSLHVTKNFFITKARKDEDTKKD